MKKNNITKKAQELDKNINELSKTTSRKLKQIHSGGDYQFHANTRKTKKGNTKKQKWILINKQGQLSGILDHNAYDTRDRAKAWFQKTSELSGSRVKIDDLYYVLKAEEYEFLKELDVLDIIADTDIN